MEYVNILDCTLRDGGYVNNWEFGYDNIKKIVGDLEKSNVDVIEMGFMRNEEYNSERSVYSSVEQISNIIGIKKDNIIYSALIEMANYFPIEMLDAYDGKSIDLIRYSFWKRLMDDGYDYCKAIVDRGYKLSVQPTRVEQYSIEDFKYMIQKFSELNPYAVYIVDTFGLLDKKLLLQYAEIADKYMPKNIILGYHPHNNMQQAMLNTVSFLELGLDREVIVDASIFGMGRGAGNLNLECIARYLNVECGKNIKLEPIYNAFDECLKSDYDKYGWGYSMGYNIVASMECNPNYSMYYTEKLNLNSSDIYQIVSKISGSDKYLFSEKRAQELYEQYLNCEV